MPNTMTIISGDVKIAVGANVLFNITKYVIFSQRHHILLFDLILNNAN